MSLTQSLAGLRMLVGIAGLGVSVTASAAPVAAMPAWLPELLPDTTLEAMPSPTRVNGVQLDIAAGHSPLSVAEWAKHLERQWLGFGADFSRLSLGERLVLARRRAPWNETAVLRSLPDGSTQIIFSRADLATMPVAAGCRLDLPVGLQLRSVVSSPQPAKTSIRAAEQCWLESRSSPGHILASLEQAWGPKGWHLNARHTEDTHGAASAVWHQGSGERLVIVNRIGRLSSVVVLQQERQ